MKKPNSAKYLANEILYRSTCQVMVGAAIEDKRGILAWGWNSSGPDGMGLHAEEHAIQRANRKRLRGSTIYIAAVRERTRRMVCSKPCERCQKLIDKWELKAVWYEPEQRTDY